MPVIHIYRLRQTRKEPLHQTQSLNAVWPALFAADIVKSGDAQAFNLGAASGLNIQNTFTQNYIVHFCAISLQLEKLAAGFITKSGLFARAVSQINRGQGGREQSEVSTKSRGVFYDSRECSCSTHHGSESHQGGDSIKESTLNQCVAPSVVDFKQQVLSCFCIAHCSFLLAVVVGVPSFFFQCRSWWPLVCSVTGFATQYYRYIQQAATQLLGAIMPVIHIYKPSQARTLEAATGHQIRIINGKPMLVKAGA